uniref:ATP synthase F0 subunit 8 n=1 Tax=Oyamia seminigra TaxID=1268355 RepID=UPI001EDD4485|nr:ATP synthase F0 subunit 8 [Oyamia seminigra]UIX54778.1 ATP synthase F0 subunit 8 [Oyamia seminigra]
MPQMAPISWLMLFIVFSCTLLMFNFMNYFSFLPNRPSQQQQTQISQTALKWKW